jgi:hypothetical protein
VLSIVSIVMVEYNSFFWYFAGLNVFLWIQNIAAHEGGIRVTRVLLAVFVGAVKDGGIVTPIVLLNDVL